MTTYGEYNLTQTIVNGPPIDIRAMAKVPTRLMSAVVVAVHGMLGSRAISS